MEKKKKAVTIDFIDSKENDKSKLKAINVKVESKGVEFKLKFIKYKEDVQ